MASYVLRSAPLVAMAAALAFGPSLAARDHDDDWYREGRRNDRVYRDNRDSYGYGGYGNGNYGYRGGTPVDRTMSDLQRAQRSMRRADGHERDHFQSAMNDLSRFQQRWQQGSFDKGRLDKAIENIQHLVNSDQVHPGDRRMLANDLAALRDFRANRGAYGNSGYGGYGPRPSGDYRRGGPWYQR